MGCSFIAVHLTDPELLKQANLVTKSLGSPYFYLSNSGFTNSSRYAWFFLFEFLESNSGHSAGETD